MEQYFPRAHVGKARRPARQAEQVPVTSRADPSAGHGKNNGIRYADINRPVEPKEISSVRKVNSKKIGDKKKREREKGADFVHLQAAEAAGLWRFVEASRHGGFNI